MAVHCPCPSNTSVPSLLAALHCFKNGSLQMANCLQRPALAANCLPVALECLNASGAGRGFFVLARDASGTAVCNHGNDKFHLRLVTKTGSLSLASLSQPVHSDAYWLSVKGLHVGDRLLPGSHEYHLLLSLIATWDHARPVASGASPLQRWLRSRVCAWQPVLLLADRITVPHELPHRGESLLPLCPGGGALPPASEAAYLRVGPSCETHEALATYPPPSSSPCVGNATRHLFGAAGGDVMQRARARQGYRHVLTFASCRLRLYGGGWHSEGGVDAWHMRACTYCGLCHLSA